MQELAALRPLILNIMRGPFTPLNFVADFYKNINDFIMTIS